ncbi:type II secretion system protein [Cerasicoccus maritimus]|uniref:type II secretion system protein n=1 Tax=Cerasicoccus maritimus TaxID=490089 RepID=UPI00285292C2|nr:prepilin-type N-terminal cleavage/methylation domain-containing protein [Cerasicoccus maritimus]
MTLSRKAISRQGFTLVELLTVIAIIGILAAILIPAVGKVQESAKKSAASSDGRQIGLAYSTFSNGGGKTRVIGNSASSTYSATTPAEFAAILADKADLNDAAIWYITSDDNLAGLSIPKTVITTAEGSSEPTNNLTSFEGPISWAITCNLSSNAPTSTTPLLYTRGIEDSASTWDTTSPWKGDGGHIIFLDGHVTFYEDLEEEPLAKYDGSGEAYTIPEAQNSNAKTYQDSVK